MLSFIDQRLNNVTMYRLLLYGLVLLIAVSLVLGPIGLIQVSYVSLLTSVAVLVASCLATNWFFAKLYKVPSNSESSLLTALILTLILNPASNPEGMVGLAVAGLVAMASKYVLAVRRKHIVNPAALAAVVVVLLGLARATWWVGTANLLPFTLLLTFLVVRKIRRQDMAITFTAVAVTVVCLLGVILDGRSIIEVFPEALLSWPIIFFVGVMLTEPLSTPSGAWQRRAYAVIVALLMTVRWDLGFIAASPALALVIGNVFSYVVGSKQRVVLTLKEVVKMAPNVWDFVFTPSEKLSFKAGQYAEWTIPLGHEKHDERGNRRYFTIASAPSEGAVRLGVKFYPEPSAFKEELQALKVGDEVMLGQVTGDFTLPAKPVPLLFLAGGIGVTPFRSMLAEMVAAGTPQDVTLVYAATSFEEVVYRDVLEGAKALGVRIILLLGKPEGVTEGWEVASGFITPELLTQLVPDAKERSVYISGPNRFVDSAKQSCKVCGVPSGSLVTDYFPGY